MLDAEIDEGDGREDRTSVGYDRMRGWKYKELIEGGE